MKHCLLVIVILVLLSGTVSATDIKNEQIKLYGMDAVIDHVPQKLQKQVDFTDLWKPFDWLAAGKEIIYDAFQNRINVVHEMIASFSGIILILLLCQIPDTLASDQWSFSSALAGSLGIFACCIDDLNGLIGLGKQVMDEMSSFSSLLIPALSAAAIGSGAVSSSSLMHVLNVFFSSMIIKLGVSFIIPAIMVFVILAFADSVLRQSQLKKVYELIGWLIKMMLKLFVYAYTGLITLTGLIAGAIDSGTHKAAKLAISTMLPVVGGIISNTADTFLASAQILKNSIGTIGLLTLLYYVFDPFLRMGASYLMLKIVSAIAGLIGSRQSTLLDNMCSGTGYLLSLVGSCAMINFLSCTSYLRTGQI